MNAGKIKIKVTLDLQFQTALFDSFSKDVFSKQMIVLNDSFTKELETDDSD